jgi:hypothetical protein
MLRQVASYGCVCVVPDLSWLTGGDGTVATLEVDFNLRAIVLVEYYNYLIRLNSRLFGSQLDLSRVVLVGHSTGGGAAIRAGRILSPFVNRHALAYGLIAPFFLGMAPWPSSIGSDVGNLLVLFGTRDPLRVEAGEAYMAGGTPKTQVTIPGANHFGYTNLPDPDNTYNSYDLPWVRGDANGTIPRYDQQQTAAAYLAALLRYYALGDSSMRPYLVGEKPVEGAETLGIQVQAEGFITTPPRPSVPPKPAVP